ncbi:MAG: hypothetical protein Q9191_004937 [Dirinaria sp. TL-2023a]
MSRCAILQDSSRSKSSPSLTELAKAGWVGKGKNPHTSSAGGQEHQSRPLSSLKDPDAFGPPPKNVNYYGGAAVPNAITPDRRGLGAPLSTEEVRASHEAEESEKRAAEEAAQKPKPPPVPYRADTTGLTTSDLPRPPVKRIDVEDEASSVVSASPTVKPKPTLPPRLPPRQATSTLEPSSPPSTYSSATQQQATGGGHLNQGALGRLGSAGVSVPGLNIGAGSNEGSTTRQAQAWQPAPARASTPVGSQKPTLNELHSRFSGLSTKSPSSESPTQGTTLAQKQAALRTASNFRNDPSSVSLSDAKATAATANNFRERHGDQVAAGWKSANALNKKYDVAGKVGGLTGNGPANEQDATSPPESATPASPAIISEKKKPPPPPPKRVGTGSGASPPPIPLSSKPKP